MIKTKDMLVSMRHRDHKGWPVPFDMSFFDLTGERIDVSNVVILGHLKQKANAFEQKTLRFMVLANQQVRQCYVLSIRLFNGTDVIP